MKGGAREVAVRFLLSVDRGRHCDALPFDPGFLELDQRDRKLATDLVYGTLRHRARMDFYVQSLSNRPLSKLDPEVLWVLRLSLYQLEFLRIPHRAAVHEAVGLSRRLKKSSASGFVNGILRSFVRSRPELPAGQSVEDLAIVFSHPEWLVKRYVSRWGVETAREFMDQNNCQPVSTLWVNPFKTDFAEFCKALKDRGVHYEPHQELSNCLLVAPEFVRHELYEEGQCFFMDPSSQRIAHEVKLEDTQIVGDFCAAPGGKSFVLASLRPGGARLFCSDRAPGRLEAMQRRSRKYNVRGLSLFLADWAYSTPVRSSFDSVLLDVPCSGLGTVRSNPDIRWRVQEEDLARLQERQLKLLRNAFSSLRRGGELLYSTCSTEPEENEGLIEAFLEEEATAALRGEFKKTFPGPCQGDAFFWARIRHS